MAEHQPHLAQRLVGQRSVRLFRIDGAGSTETTRPAIDLLPFLGPEGRFTFQP